MASIARKASKALFTLSDLAHPRPVGPRVLIYHQVGTSLGRQMEVTTRDFTRQLDWLLEHRRVIDLDQALSSENRLDSKSVVITFDDGYRDTYETAFPLISERRLPFTLFLCTDHIETRRPLDPAFPAEPLTWEMVSDMLRSGLVTIGAHTHTHADLRYMARREVELEVAKSDSVFNDRLRFLPRHFAYPWGYWGEEADDVLRSRYESASLGAPTSSSPPSDRYRLHRYPVQLSDGFAFFTARLRGGFLYEERLRRRLRSYAGP